MYKFLAVLSILSYFIFSTIVQAAVSPELIDPVNGMQVFDTSPRLSWNYSGKCPLDNSSCFKVEISDSDNFATLLKSIYTNSSSYSPQNLDQKKWYWRVKSKDENGVWSEYSQSHFIIVAPEITPVPTSVPAGTTEDNSIKSNEFLITGLPSQTDSTSIYKINISLKGYDANTAYNIKGAFYKDGSTNYFGKTLVNNLWVKNSSTSTSQFLIYTDNQGNFMGNIDVMVDSEDTGFSGSGEYFFKVAKYSSSTGPTWSNALKTNITHIIYTTPKPTQKPTIQAYQQNPTATSSTLVNNGKSNGILINRLNDNESTKEATIAGFSSKLETQNKETSNKNNFNYPFIAGGVMFLSASIFTLVKAYKKR